MDFPLLIHEYKSLSAQVRRNQNNMLAMVERGSSKR